MIGRVQVRKAASRLQVRVPYNEQFVLGAHGLRGRWKYRTEFWSFPGNMSPEVFALLERIYGRDAVRNAWVQ